MPPSNPIALLPEHLLVRRLLGRGGSSVVYEAQHTRLRVRVAVKVLACAIDEQVGAEQRLLREAELYAGLCSPYVPHVYDVGQLPDGRPYVVMELVAGETLAEHLAEGPLSMEEALALTQQVLKALIAVHDAGIVHRDIKPSNIMVLPYGASPRVRLLDFGIAKSLAQTAEPLTLQGALIGTPQYMSSEQIAGQGLDPRSDLYAVGVVLYEMLSGKVPFDGHTVGEVLAASSYDHPPRLRSFRSDVPPSLERLLDRALTRDLSLRFASAREMLNAVEHQQLLLAGRRRAPRRRARRCLVLLALAACILLLPMRLAERGHEVGGLLPLVYGPPRSVAQRVTRAPRTPLAPPPTAPTARALGTEQTPTTNHAPAQRFAATFAPASVRAPASAFAPAQDTTRVSRAEPRSVAPAADLPPTRAPEQRHEREGPRRELSSAARTSTREAVATPSSLPPNPY